MARLGFAQGEHDLAEREQFRHAAVAASADDHDCRQDGQHSSNNAAYPRRDPPVHEAFHHHLSGERAGDRRRLSAGQEGHRKQDASGRSAQQRGQRNIRDANPIAIRADLGSRHDRIAVRKGLGSVQRSVKHDCREHHDRRVDEKGDGQGHGRIERVKLDRAADRIVVLGQLAGLHEGRVQIKVMRHDSGPDDADGHVNHFLVAKCRQRRDHRAAHFDKIGTHVRQNEYLDKVTGRYGADEPRSTMASMVRIPNR